MTHTHREAETQAEGEAGSMHREPDVGFDPESPGSRPGPKAGAKPLRHPGIPHIVFIARFCELHVVFFPKNEFEHNDMKIQVENVIYNAATQDAVENH